LVFESILAVGANDQQQSLKNQNASSDRFL
jgi:hypothetical protein